MIDNVARLFFVGWAGSPDHAFNSYKFIVK